MSRSRGGSGAAVRGPLRKILSVVELLGTDYQPRRRRVTLECGHTLVIASASSHQARCSGCLAASPVAVHDDPV
jgi:hypothetical protein